MAVPRSSVSSALVEIDVEIGQIDAEIGALRRRKQTLLEKKKELERRLAHPSGANDGHNDEDQWENDNFPWSAEAKTVLKNVFKLDDFRPLQKATINAVMSKEDVVVIMSTGGGKSLCYQLPAVLSKGLTLVVSPLISLIEDQLSQLARLGIEAATLNQSTHKDEVKRIEAAITNKTSNFRLLYVTPEKLAKSKRIMNKLEKSVEQGFLKLIAIDEVHCCSQWGHDFRTDYKFLNILKRQFKGIPILGLTATATMSVLDDVKQMLGIPAAPVFRAGFNRPNLRYEVRDKPSSDVVEEMAKLIKTRFTCQSGIVYCFSRKDCEDVTKQLKQNGIAAAFYHAYLEPNQRSMVHEAWLADELQVIVATVAFGMGIDKPDVRFVIHHAIPKSVENYYQESGRAGRDGKPATCIIYFRMADVFRQSTMVCSEKTGLQNLYSMVRYASERENCRRVSLAEHFEESWEPDWCQKGCDVCSEPGTSKSIDIAKYAKDAMACIQEHKDNVKNDGSGRITAGKLLEVLMKRSKIKKVFCESIILNLLLGEYLEEDFHFTPYSIISYIVPGKKWRLYKGTPIMMTTVDVKTNPVESSKMDRKRSRNTAGVDDDAKTPAKSKKKIEKKKAVVSSDSEDEVAQGSKKTHDDDEVVMLDDSDEVEEENEDNKKNNSEVNKTGEKKKRWVIDSDDDDDDFV